MTDTLNGSGVAVTKLAQGLQVGASFTTSTTGTWPRRLGFGGRFEGLLANGD